MNTDDLWRGKRADAATVVAAVGAAASSLAAGLVHGNAKIGPLIGVAVLTALAAYIPYKGKQLERRDKLELGEVAADAEVRLRLAIGDSLNPLVDGLARLHLTRAGKDRERLRGEVKQAVLHATTRLVQGTRVRACFFVLAAAHVSEPQRLLPDTSSGRSTPPHQVFRAGTTSGDAALSMIMRRERRFCRDVATDPPPGWVGTVSGYTTFVAVPVVVGNRDYGMFTVDAVQPGDLDDEEEVGLVDLLANLLGAVVSV